MLVEQVRRALKNMGWIYLTLAGFFEIGFTTMLKMSDGFNRLWPSLLFGVFAGSSFWLLMLATKNIPLGTAYAVWTGIGAFGTAVVGILFFGDPTNLPRVFFLTTLIISIVGLKFFSETAP
jgi:quaternary ammonium compound-resistance protein SugE